MGLFGIHTLLDALIWAAVALNFLMGGLVFFKNRASLTHRHYGAFVGFLNAWIVMNFLENEPRILDGRFGDSFLRMDFVFAIFIVYSWFRFCDAFSSEEGSRLNPRILRVVLGASSLLALFSYATPLVIHDTAFAGEVMVFENGFLFPLYAMFIVGLAAWGLFILVKTRQEARRKRLFRRSGQIDLMLMGFVISIGTAMFINLFLQPVYGVSLAISRIGLYGMSALAILTGYAIVRHRLFDIKLVIQRGVIYLVLFALVTGVYLALVSFLGYLFHRVTDTTIVASAVLTATAGIFGIRPVEQFFRRITDRIFFKDAYDYATVLRQLSEALGSTLDLKKLIETVAAILRSSLRIEFAEFAIFENEFAASIPPGIGGPTQMETLEAVCGSIRRPVLQEELRYLAKATSLSSRQKSAVEGLESLCNTHDIALVVPLSLKRKALGAILLGGKRSGDAYRDDDIKLLHTFSHQATIAFSKTELYRRVKEYSEELEARVLARTNEIKELQEEQRQIMIDLSHGLQTPLTVAKGELEFLKKTSPGNKKLQAFERSIDEVSKFIYDLLRFSSLETRTAFKRERVDMTSLVEGVLEYSRIVAEERGIGIASEISPGIVIEGDRRRLEELVTNLVSNAMKYMRKRGRREIIVRLAAVSGRAVEFSVADTGIGIAPEDLKKVFTRFYRARPEGSLGIKGTGLGLAIAKRIAERHGGTIRAESAPGAGSTFTVTLPRAPGARRKRSRKR